jgi:hypothetical protein
MTWTDVWLILKRDYTLSAMWARIIGWRPDWFEWIGIICTVASTIWYLSWYDWIWHAWVMSAAMIVCGYLSGDMIHRLWSVR